MPNLCKFSLCHHSFVRCKVILQRSRNIVHNLWTTLNISGQFLSCYTYWESHWISWVFKRCKSEENLSLHLILCYIVYCGSRSAELHGYNSHRSQQSQWDLHLCKWEQNLHQQSVLPISSDQFISSLSG